MPVTCTGRDKEMTGPISVGGDRMIHRSSDVNWGGPVAGERLQGVRASIGARKHGNACGAKGSRKVNE